MIWKSYVFYMKSAALRQDCFQLDSNTGRPALLALVFLYRTRISSRRKRSGESQTFRGYAFQIY